MMRRYEEKDREGYDKGEVRDILISRISLQPSEQKIDR